jgi:histidine ammonia-lyase
VRGLQLRAPLTPSPAGRVAVAIVESFAGRPGPDVFLAPIIEDARAVVAGRRLRQDIEAALAGKLL